jgi:hypothetical protein
MFRKKLKKVKTDSANKKIVASLPMALCQMKSIVPAEASIGRSQWTLAARLGPCFTRPLLASGTLVSLELCRLRNALDTAEKSALLLR